MDELLRDGLKTVRNCLTIVLLGCIVAASIAYWRGRRITQVLSDFTDEIGDMSAEKLSELPVKDEYEETYVLSTTFNGMIHRIEELIEDIRIREKENSARSTIFYRRRSIRISLTIRCCRSRA